MTPMQTRVLDVIKATPRLGAIDISIRTKDFESSVRRVTQELRRAGLIEAVKASEGSIDRVLFVPTVQPNVDAVAAEMLSE